MTAIKKPAKLKDIVADYFHAARADRDTAATNLFNHLKTQRHPDIRLYLIARASRLLIHEYARQQRVKTPVLKRLMDYPICTSKYLSEAFCSDLYEEVGEHASHAATNFNKRNFFAELAQGVQAEDEAKDHAHQIKDVYDEKDLEEIYERHIGVI